MSRARVTQIPGTEGYLGMETKARSLVKAGLWTALGLLVMAATGYLYTGSLVTAGMLGVSNSVLGFVTYIIYERVWAQIAWGRRDHAG